MKKADYWGHFKGVPYDGLNKEETIDNFLYTIKANLLYKEERIKELREELNTVKNEAYADEEMAKMKATVEKLRADICRGFPISPYEEEQIQEWRKNHNTTVHANPKGYHGAIGGGYSYKFIPTSIGTIGTIICKQCNNKANQLAVVDGKFDDKKWQEAMEELDGSFEFHELG